MAKNKCRYCGHLTKTTSLDFWESVGWCTVFICKECDFEWLDTEYHTLEEAKLFAKEVEKWR